MASNHPEKTELRTVIKELRQRLNILQIHLDEIRQDFAVARNRRESAREHIEAARKLLHEQTRAIPPSVHTLRQLLTYQSADTSAGNRRAEHSVTVETSRSEDSSDVQRPDDISSIAANDSEDLHTIKTAQDSKDVPPIQAALVSKDVPLIEFAQDPQDVTSAKATHGPECLPEGLPTIKTSHDSEGIPSIEAALISEDVPPIEFIQDPQDVTSVNATHGPECLPPPEAPHDPVGLTSIDAALNQESLPQIEGTHDSEGLLPIEIAHDQEGPSSIGAYTLVDPVVTLLHLPVGLSSKPFDGTHDSKNKSVSSGDRSHEESGHSEDTLITALHTEDTSSIEALGKEDQPGVEEQRPDVSPVVRCVIDRSSVRTHSPVEKRGPANESSSEPHSKRKFPSFDFQPRVVSPVVMYMYDPYEYVTEYESKVHAHASNTEISTARSASTSPKSMRLKTEEFLARTSTEGRKAFTGPSKSQSLDYLPVYKPPTITPILGSTSDLEVLQITDAVSADDSKIRISPLIRRPESKYSQYLLWKRTQFLTRTFRPGVTYKSFSMEYLPVYKPRSITPDLGVKSEIEAINISKRLSEGDAGSPKIKISPLSHPVSKSPISTRRQSEKFFTDPFHRGHKYSKQSYKSLSLEYLPMHKSGATETDLEEQSNTETLKVRKHFPKVDATSSKIKCSPLAIRPASTPPIQIRRMSEQLIPSKHLTECKPRTWSHRAEERFTASSLGQEIRRAKNVQNLMLISPMGVRHSRDESRVERHRLEESSIAQSLLTEDGSEECKHRSEELISTIQGEEQPLKISHFLLPKLVMPCTQPIEDSQSAENVRSDISLSSIKSVARALRFEENLTESQSEENVLAASSPRKLSKSVARAILFYDKSTAGPQRTENIQSTRSPLPPTRSVARFLRLDTPTPSSITAENTQSDEVSLPPPQFFPIPSLDVNLPADVRNIGHEVDESLESSQKTSPWLLRPIANYPLGVYHPEDGSSTSSLSRPGETPVEVLRPQAVSSLAHQVEDESTPVSKEESQTGESTSVFEQLPSSEYDSAFENKDDKK